MHPNINAQRHRIRATRSSQSILKEINPKYSTGRTVAEAEGPILWIPDVNNQIFKKDPDTGKD